MSIIVWFCIGALVAKFLLWLFFPPKKRPESQFADPGKDRIYKSYER